MNNFNNADDAFSSLYNYILVEGNVKEGTRYIRRVCFTILNPLDNQIKTPWRKWSHDYAKLEWAWYVSGNRDPKMVAERAKLWEQMKDSEGKVNSNYGNWWHRNNQLERVVKLLQEKPNTRRGIVVHYNPDEVQNYERDTPCNVVLDFYIEDGKICMDVYARSIDLVYGFCNDQYCFSMLLNYMGMRLIRDVGTFTYFISDLHIYEKHWDMRDKWYGVQELPLKGAYPGDNGATNGMSY